MRSIILILALSGCYAEWDIPVTPRRDPCTNKVDVSYVYVYPVCRNPAPPAPQVGPAGLQ